ncbi:unnamed protein product, partial [Rotaria sp. Silwood1]
MGQYLNGDGTHAYVFVANGVNDYGVAYRDGNFNALP